MLSPDGGLGPSPQSSSASPHRTPPPVPHPGHSPLPSWLPLLLSLSTFHACARGLTPCPVPGRSSLQPWIWRGLQSSVRKRVWKLELRAGPTVGLQPGRALGQLPRLSRPSPVPPQGFSCLSCSPEPLNLVISVVLGGGLAAALGGDRGPGESHSADRASRKARESHSRRAPGLRLDPAQRGWCRRRAGAPAAPLTALCSPRRDLPKTEAPQPCLLGEGFSAGPEASGCRGWCSAQACFLPPWALSRAGEALAFSWGQGAGGHLQLMPVFF